MIAICTVKPLEVDPVVGEQSQAVFYRILKLRGIAAAETASAPGRGGRTHEQRAAEPLRA